jgi:Raf kinase inhibitor-like YbhB/YbcL family protein
MTTRARFARLGAPLVIASLAAACAPERGPAPSSPSGVTPSSITVTSRSFASGGTIPVDYSCDGKDVSPQLTWSAPPQGTKALVIVVDDPDAPSGTFTHWLVIDLGADALTLAEGVDPSTLGAKVGANDFHNVRYNGPCPPKGEQHRYQFTVFASDAPLPLNEGATRADVDAALSGHVLGSGTLTALFAR